MTISSSGSIIGRIETATEKSPIAVFEVELSADNPNTLRAVFASTVLSQQEIARANGNLVGVFHGGINMQEVLATLKEKEGKS